eukprot:336765-Heterocapsa_arctica.AAC.1
MGVHDIQPKFGPLALAVYAALNKTAHAGSYPWRAACSNCGKECNRTSGWAKRGRQTASTREAPTSRAPSATK